MNGSVTNTDQALSLPDKVLESVSPDIYTFLCVYTGTFGFIIKWSYLVKL